MTASAFASLLHARRSGKGHWMALCPAHPDHHPSLSVWEGKKHPVMFKCNSQGCTQDSILAAMGLTWADVLEDRPVDRDTLRKIRLEDERKARVAGQLRTLRLEAMRRASTWQAKVETLAGRCVGGSGTDEDWCQLDRAMSLYRKYERILDSLDYPWLRGFGVSRLG